VTINAAISARHEDPAERQAAMERAVLRLLSSPPVSRTRSARKK
jgi:hypothetical protein